MTQDVVIPLRYFTGLAPSAWFLRGGLSLLEMMLDCWIFEFFY